ncbi:hypothetical protein E4T42_00485 [Aureobasidium subglaciale]|nr:hypothetical protein E4T42_00485 [Aureobasidium subglaciale]
MDIDLLSHHRSVLKREAMLRKIRQIGVPRRITHTRETLMREFIHRPMPFRPVAGSAARPVPADAYTPSYLPLAHLIKISLKDLQCETHHHGRFLLLRVFCQPFRKLAITAAVEDETEDVDKMSLYHTKDSLRAFEILPEGSVITIKEPFYKMEDNGAYTIRVDHPSDMGFLDPHNEMYPEEWKDPEDFQMTALEWKLEGNQAFAREEYLEAHRCYTRGLARADSHELDLKHDLLRNRSSANLRLSHYDQAISDAFFSLTSDQDDPEFRRKNSEAHCLRGRANYNLGHYTNALKSFKEMLQLSPSDANGKKELARTEARLVEEHGGLYDFAEVVDEVIKNGYSADRASFISNTQMRQTEDRGQGLFATKEIRLGELIVCEKAFMTAHPSDDKPKSPMSGWLSSVQKVIDNPSQSSNMLGLYSGRVRSSTTSVPIIDGLPVFDTYEFLKILDLNGFSYEVGQETKPYGTTAHMSPTSPKSTGLWTHVSNANHSCLANATRSFIGDMIILRAARDIARDEEITIAYLNPQHLLAKRQRAFAGAWSFVCTCPLCDWERRTTVHAQELAENIETGLAFMGDKLHDTTLPDDSSILILAELLAEDLEDSYADHLLRRLPCLGMAHVWQWLSQIYLLQNNRAALGNSSYKVLLSYGYWVKVQDSIVRVELCYGIPAVGVVDAFMCLAHLAGEDDVELSSEFKAWARMIYKIVNGIPLGFELKYGD